MISTLSVQNIALIDKLELELDGGLNILSGETGAGKSIIIDSINFVLGERADRSLIRYGTDFAAVEAVFSDYLTGDVSEYLSDNGMDAEEILIIRRKMTVEGKNECRVNGKPVTLSMLKGLTELLVDVHGQHEHQSLLKVSTHIGLVDKLGGAAVENQLQNCRQAHKKYVELKKEYSSLGNAEERAAKIDVLSYQIKEIKDANVLENEEDQLLDRRKAVRNQEKLLTALGSVKQALNGYEATAVTSALKTSSATLLHIAEFDSRLPELCDRLDAAKTEIADISSTVSDISDALEYDGRSAEELEERLALVRTIQRKYGGDYESVYAFLENAEKEYDRLTNATERVAVLETELQRAADALVLSAKKLTELRIKTSNAFEKSILKELNDLGMSGSTFKVNIVSEKEADRITENGADNVEFLISPNVGEPLKPLAKIISGGEMSRFMLALKNILADIDGIGTMIFDEIDTGISGNISAVVSKKLCNISRKRQVIAVTHMPSLAAMADTHFLITKFEKDGKSHTSLDKLQDDTDEIARLIGGSDYSSHAVPHALEMKKWAEQYKKSLATK